ncbi:MAG TPA: right-handed parallel beta-helix repeat-containing protein, partial [Candidatus Binatia bacterium]
MNYFQSYSLPADAGVVAAWDSEIARAKEVPPLARLIAERGAELYPEFAKRYAEVRALPRSARRALQKRLAKSRDLAAIPAKWQRRLAYSIAGAALLLVLSDGPLQAATINVGPGCTLTQAILSAENDISYGSCTAGSGPDTIVLPAGSKIGVTSTYPGPYSATGLPTVTTPITIDGNFSTISRKKGPLMRLMAVSSTGDLTLNSLTLSGGNSYPNGGGAVYNAGILEVNNCIITGNFSGGGAISNAGTATISGTTFSKNTASYGGAVYNYGTLELLSNTIVTGNRAFYAGGGVFNSYGETEITSSTISKNTAYLGGGISNYKGTLTVDPTLITGNKAAGGG